MARGREEETPEVEEEDVAPPEGNVVRYVTYGVGEADDARWGWEGLDVAGQVVRRSDPVFESEKAVEKAIKDEQGE